MSSEIEIQPWSATEYSNLALVQEVKKHPCLYNNTLPEYSRKDITGRVWQGIAEKFGCTVSAVKKRWKNTRTVYFREKVSACRGKKKKKHYLEKHLNFLLPFTYSRKLMRELACLSKGQSKVDPNNEQTMSCDVDNSATELGRLPIDNNNQTTNDNLGACNRKVKAVKPTIAKSVDTNNQAKSSEGWQNNPVQTPTETYFIAPCETQNIQKDSASFSLADNEDFRKQFMMSLLPEIEEMPEPKFRSFKRKILHLIDDVKADEENVEALL